MFCVVRIFKLVSFLSRTSCTLSRFSLHLRLLEVTVTNIPVTAGEGPDFAVKQQRIDLATSQAKQTTCYSPYAPTAKDMDTTSRTASSSSRSLYRLLNTQIFAGTTIHLSSQSVKTPKTTVFARMVVNTNASFA